MAERILLRQGFSIANPNEIPNKIGFFATTKAFRLYAREGRDGLEFVVKKKGGAFRELRRSLSSRRKDKELYALFKKHAQNLGALSDDLTKKLQKAKKKGFSIEDAVEISKTSFGAQEADSLSNVTGEIADQAHVSEAQLKNEQLSNTSTSTASSSDIQVLSSEDGKDPVPLLDSSKSSGSSSRVSLSPRKAPPPRIKIALSDTEHGRRYKEAKSEPGSFSVSSRDQLEDKSELNSPDNLAEDLAALEELLNQDIIS